MYYIKVVEIHPFVRRNGISDEEISHAVENLIEWVEAALNQCACFSRG
jgi:hypothetical protein